MNIHFLQLPQNPFADAPTSPTAFGNTSPMPSHSPMAGATDKNVDFTDKLRRALESDNRTDYESRLLFEEIKNSQFFETFNERNSATLFEKNAFIHLCKRLKYEKFPAKQVVFRQNDVSNGKLYLIYSGEVSIVIKSGESMANSAQPKSSAPLKTDPNKQDEPKSAVLKQTLKRGDSLAESSPEGNNAKSNKVIPTITLNHPNKSKFASTSDDIKEKSLKIDKSMLNSSKEDSLMGTPKGGNRKKDSINLHGLSGFHEGVTQNNIDNDKGTGHSHASRRTVRNLKNHQAEQESPRSVEAKKQSEKEARIKLLHAKLRAATNVTLGAIKFGKIASKKNRKSSEEEESMLSLEELIRKYGKLENKIEKGAFFGERALFMNNPRAATIITNTECEFLVMNQRDFNFVSDNFDSKRKQRIKFMMDYIPDIENINAYEAVERILYVLQEKTYERGSLITNEGDAGEYIHIICDGTCDMLKNIKIEEAADKDNLGGLKRLAKGNCPQEHQITVCKIQRGVFIGEELLYDHRNKYSFSVKVTSAFAKVYSIHRANYFSKLSGTVQTEIQKIFNSKVMKYASLIRDLVSTKYPDMLVVSNNQRNKDLGQLLLNDKLVLKQKENSIFDSPKEDTLHSFQRKEKRASTFKLNANKPGTYFEQDSPFFNHTPEHVRQKTETFGELKQKKHAMSPFMRAMVPSQSTGSLRPAFPSGLRAFTQGDEDVEEQKGFMDSVKISDILNHRTKITSRTESPCQSDYIPVNRKSCRTLAPLAAKPRHSGLGVSTTRESNGSFGQTTSIPSSSVTERPSKLISADPATRISTFESDDLQEDKIVPSPTVLQKHVSDGYPAARIDSLFKRSQRKLRKKFIAIETRAGQAQMSPQAEYCYLSSEDLYLTQSSLPKTEKWAKNEDFSYFGKNDSIIKSPTGPKGLLYKGQNSHTKSNPGLLDHSHFLTATPLLEGARDEITDKEKHNKLKRQNSDKEETHSARLKRKHQIRLQLRSKRDRESLQIQRNTSISKAENKINSARGESQQH